MGVCHISHATHVGPPLSVFGEAQFYLTLFYFHFSHWLFAFLFDLHCFLQLQQLPEPFPAITDPPASRPLVA